MRILDPRQFSQVNRKRPKRRWIRILFLLLVVISLPAYTTYAYFGPLPSVAGTVISLPELANADIAIPWPAVGQAAVGAQGFNVLSATNTQTPVPMASVAKVFTALMILKQKPLQPGQAGPMITVTVRDIDIYNRYIAIDGAVVPVAVGQQISEHQALQALLIPSANNIADMLAIWAYGSLADYVAAANRYAQILGLNQTRIADASGFSPDTTSTARDAVLLGQEALKNPVIGQIVDSARIDLPLAGIVQNTNRLISEPGFVGIKTGHTDEAGGCFLFAARHEVAPGVSVTVIGAILGAQDITAAINSAPPILAAAYSGFGMTTLIKKGQTVGNYTPPWISESVDTVTDGDITVPVWKGKLPKITVALNPIAGRQPKGAAVGSVSVNADYVHQSVPVSLSKAIPEPAISWRLKRYL